MHLPIVCTAAVLLGGHQLEPIDLGFHPARGTLLHKSFEVESRGRLDRIWLGNTDLSGSLPGREIAVQASLRVTDEYLRVAHGRPLELVRDFDGLRTVWESRERSEVPHPLLYRSVRFTWDERDGAYRTDWESRRRLPDVPPTVWEDLDYRTLLPDGPVRIGERWSVPCEALAPVLLPGGPIHRERAVWEAWRLFDLEQACTSGSLHWHVNDELDCRLEEILWVDGRRVARIGLAWRWWGWVDLVSALEEHPWARLISLDGVVVELAMDGSGELLWDLEGGHFQAFELRAELDAEVHLELGRGCVEVRASGQGLWTAEVSRAD